MDIAIVGGSNCIIKDGFGKQLESLFLSDKRINFFNFSLGASCSLY